MKCPYCQTLIKECPACGKPLSSAPPTDTSDLVDPLEAEDVSIAQLSIVPPSGLKKLSDLKKMQPK